jgi:hypothetical protein
MAKNLQVANCERCEFSHPWDSSFIGRGRDCPGNIAQWQEFGSQMRDINSYDFYFPSSCSYFLKSKNIFKIIKGNIMLILKYLKIV